MVPVALCIIAEDVMLLIMVYGASGLCIIAEDVMLLIMVYGASGLVYNS